MCELLSETGTKSLTIAIESGSSRMRDIINKKLPQEEIFKAAIQKVSEMPEEEESDEDLEENPDTITESDDKEETYATYDFKKDGHMAIFAYPHHYGKDTKDSLKDWKNKDSDKRTVKFVDDYREAQAGVLRLKNASKE
jgi:radical SAM superfamily enzyme YgiQ (UPF0313 family)